MILKKSLTLFILAALLTTVTLPVYGQLIPLKEIENVEMVLYGQPGTGSVLARIKRIELDLFGSAGKGTLPERSNQILKYALPTEDSPSLQLLINCLEWSLLNSISRGAAVDRVAELEEMIYGASKSGALLNRINELLEMTVPGGKLPVAEVEMPEGLVIEAKLLDEIDSAVLTEGQFFRFEVTEDIELEECMVIPTGTRGLINVDKVKEAGGFGKDAELTLSLSDFKAIDGTILSIEFFSGDDDSHSREIAVGAGFLGALLVSNPVGLVAGYFYKGKDVVIEEGTPLSIEITNGLTVYGLKTN